MKESYYFSAVATLVNVPFRVVPKAPTAVTIAIERNPAISAYSMAVAASSSLTNLTNNMLIGAPFPGGALSRQSGFYVAHPVI